MAATLVGEVRGWDTRHVSLMKTVMALTHPRAWLDGQEFRSMHRNSRARPQPAGPDHCMVKSQRGTDRAHELPSGRSMAMARARRQHHHVHGDRGLRSSDSNCIVHVF
jgi:hypothetical protein